MFVRFVNRGAGLRTSGSFSPFFESMSGRTSNESDRCERELDRLVPNIFPIRFVRRVVDAGSGSRNVHSGTLIQGDALWLLQRIPDRWRSRSTEIESPDPDGCNESKVFHVITAELGAAQKVTLMTLERLSQTVATALITNPSGLLVDWASIPGLAHWLPSLSGSRPPGSTDSACALFRKERRTSGMVPKAGILGRWAASLPEFQTFSYRSWLWL